MHSVPFSLQQDRNREPLGRRAIALLVVIAIHILLATVLLLLSPPRFGKPAGDATVFTLLPDLTPAPKPAPEKKQAAKPAPKPKQKTQAITPPTPPVDKATPAEKPFTVQLFDAIDIAKLPNQRTEMAAAANDSSADAGTGSSNDTALAPGSGPNGEKLYAAQWQREPTDAELAFYLPKRGVAEGSWAVIACRTIDRFKVDDCVAQGESPPGSGLSRSILNAAWQFRVLPPRIGGKSQVGTWVSIRISFSKNAAG